MNKITLVTLTTSLGVAVAASTVESVEAIDSITKKIPQDKKSKSKTKSSEVEVLSSLVGVSTSNSLNVRSGPGTNYSSLGKLNKGDKVDIISQENSVWYKINYNGKIAYVSATYIEVQKNVEPDYIVENVTDKYGKIAKTESKTLYLKGVPNEDGASICSLNEGDVVKITGRVSNNWLRVTYNEKEGFVPSKNVTQIKTSKGEVYKLSKGDTLNVRESSSTSSKILFKLNSGDKVDILNKLSNGWYEISFNNKIGFVSNYYIKETETPKEDTSENNKVNTTKYKVLSSIRLRKTPNWSGEQVSVAARDSILNVVSISNGWAKVLMPDDTYTYAPVDNYLEKVDETPGNTDNAVKTTKHTVIDMPIKLREQPAWSAPSKHSIKIGEILDVIEKDTNWAKISYNNEVLYAPSQYLKEVDSSNNSKPDVKPETPNTKPYTVVDQDIKLREEKSWTPNYRYIVKKGETLNVIEKDNDWAKVYHNGEVLYAPSQYLKANANDKEDAPSTPEKPKTISYVATSNINIRSQTGWSSDTIIREVKAGDTLEVVSIEGDWAKVYDNNSYGYVHAQYIIKKDLNEKPESSNTKYTLYNTTLNEYVELQAKSVSYSASTLKEYIDPSKCLDFEFLELNKFREISVNKLNGIFESKNAGVLKGQGQHIYNTAKKYNIDPLYLAVQSILETGYGKSTLAKGVTITEIANESKPIKNAKGEITGYEMIKLDAPVTVYNLYGIGAKDNTAAMPNRALILGTTYAYNKGWTSVEAAIDGAGSFVSSGYINSSKYNQNTLYKIRFNPSQTYIWHQYATAPSYSRNIAKIMEQYKYVYTDISSLTYDKTKFTDSQTRISLISNLISSESEFMDLENSYIKKDIVLEKPWESK